MWKVADHDTTIYLFGTIHLLPKGTQWRSPTFDKAAAGSDTLVVETVIDEANPAETIGVLFKLAVAEGLPPLADRVEPDKKAALAAAIAKSGVPAPFYDKLETWAAGFLLLGVQFKDLGLDPGSGVEIDAEEAIPGRRASRSASSKPMPSSWAFSTGCRKKHSANSWRRFSTTPRR